MNKIVTGEGGELANIVEDPQLEISIYLWAANRFGKYVTNKLGEVYDC